MLGRLPQKPETPLGPTAPRPSHIAHRFSLRTHVCLARHRAGSGHWPPLHYWRRPSGTPPTPRQQRQVQIGRCPWLDRVSANRASRRSSSSSSLGRNAQSANGSSASSVPCSWSANINSRSRSRPGLALNAARRARLWSSRSTSSWLGGYAHIWVRSAWSSLDPSSPRGVKAVRQ